MSAGCLAQISLISGSEEATRQLSLPCERNCKPPEVTGDYYATPTSSLGRAWVYQVCAQERGPGFAAVPPAFSTEPGTQWAPPKSGSVPTGLLPPPLPAPAPLGPKSLQTPAQVRLSLTWAAQLGNRSPRVSTSEGNLPARTERRQ